MPDTIRSRSSPPALALPDTLATGNTTANFPDRPQISIDKTRTAPNVTAWSRRPQHPRRGEHRHRSDHFGLLLLLPGTIECAHGVGDVPAQARKRATMGGCECS